MLSLLYFKRWQEDCNKKCIQDKYSNILLNEKEKLKSQ